MPRLSDAEFKRLHKKHINSREWKAFRTRFLISKGLPLWYHVDHKRYWKDGTLIFGHETFDDVRGLPPNRHRKGVHSDWSIEQDAKSEWWLRLLVRATNLIWLLVVATARGVWRLLRATVSGALAFARFIRKP